jgi:preprotein translocase subunit SecD
MINFPKWKMFLVIAVCAWGIFQSIPNFLTADQLAKYKFLPDNTIKLGLDLQGGSHLLLQVDFKHYLTEHLDALLDDVRKNFRTEKIGYLNLAVKKTSDISAISFTLRDKNQAEIAEEKLKEISRDFTIEIDDKGLVRAFYNEDAIARMKKGVIEKSIEIVRRRVDETGTREPIIQMQGGERILLQVPGLQNPEELKKLLGRTAKMTFHLMDNNDPFAVTTSFAKPGTMLLPDVDPNQNQKYLVNKKVELSGDMLIDSQTTFDQANPVVSFKFNNLGGKKFGQITAENVGKPFAVVLDGKVITAPRINQAILGGSGIITGNFTVQEANELSLLLRSGALPAPLTILEERTVGPSLGQDSIDAGKVATAVAFAFITIMMLVIYKTFGFFANIALIANMFLILSILSLFGATLTMPGIAGLVLTMGMAVDANVLIFERIKDELRNGKSPIAAIDSGFKAAFTTILDSNLTTVIAAFLLFAYGSGSVKGFAVTLTIGILSSMFTAILVTKLLIIVWLKKYKPKTLKL